jgi:hypothetical protein
MEMTMLEKPSQALRRIEFHGKALWAVGGEDPTRTWLAIARVCQNLHLPAHSQIERIQRHPVLSPRYTVIRVPSGGGWQETGCLRLDYVHFWLASISPLKVSSAKQAVLVAYQEECASVLYRHFRFVDQSDLIAREAVQRVPYLRSIDGKLDQIIGQGEVAASRTLEDRPRQEAILWRVTGQEATVQQLALDADDDRKWRARISEALRTLTEDARYVRERLAHVEQRKKYKVPTPGQQIGAARLARQQPLF